MLTQAAQLAIVAWLPGAIVFRAPWGGRSRRAGLDAEERVFWTVVISLAISLFAAVALAWLGLYTFGRLLAADLFVAACVAGLSRFDLRLTGAPSPGLSALLPVLLIAIGVWRFFPPAEYVIGGKDPGVYMNEGIQIAQRGTFLYEDPLVAAVPPFARDLFFPSHQRPDYYSVRFMGFHIIDPDTGLVVGQFPHLFPAAAAVAYGIDGLTGARRTAGICATLGLLALYFAGARLLGRRVGAAAAVLLALNLVQVWYAKYPNAEVLLQPLLFAALLATARAHVDEDRFFEPVAGCLLGLLLFLKLDGAPLAIAGTVLGIALLAVTGGRLRWRFLACLGVTSAIGLAYLAVPLRVGSHQAIVFFVYMAWWTWVLLAAGALATIGLLIGASRFPAIRARVRTLAPRALAGILIVLGVYAMFFRHPQGRLAPHDAYALRTFTEYYLTLPVLLAALLGFALAAYRVFWRAPELFTTIAAFSLFYFYKIRIVPDHFWMTRRFLPMILPGALLFAAAAALGTRTGRRWTLLPRWALGLIFLSLVGMEYERASRPILDHVEYAGVIPRLERLAGTIGEDDLLIVESRDAGTDVHTLALPLAYIYARNVLVLNSAAPDKAAFAGFLQWADDRYTRVLFLGAGGTDLLSREWNVRVLHTERFQLPEYDAPLNEFPRYARAKQFDYTVYEFTPPAVEERGTGFELDVGVSDDLNVLRFYAKEDTEGRTFRWSQDVSYIVLPGIDAANREITVWMHDGGRPPAAPAADVTIALDQEVLGTVRVGTGFAAYAVQIPDTLAARLAERDAPVRLKLSVPVWNPEEVLGTPDDRELGVMVDRVTVK